MGIISREFLSGIKKYVDCVKEDMMTAVDILTKCMTVVEGKQLKHVQLIRNKD